MDLTATYRKNNNIINQVLHHLVQKRIQINYYKNGIKELKYINKQEIMQIRMPYHK